MSLSITVCGYETLTATEGVHTYEWLFVADPSATTNEIASYFVTNDTDCPANAYTVLNAASQVPTDDETALF